MQVQVGLSSGEERQVALGFGLLVFGPGPLLLARGVSGRGWNRMCQVQDWQLMRGWYGVELREAGSARYVWTQADRQRARPSPDAVTASGRVTQTV